MAIPVRNKNQVWEFPFEGIEQMNAITNSIGQPQIEIMFSTADKVSELINMCQFNERNSEYFRFGFCSSKANQLILWGPGSHANLLNALQSSIIPKENVKIFRYSFS
jgi:hypothetical protein